MKAYPDTGFLVSLHSRDANTARALVRMKKQALPLAWTWLHELEFRNAMRLRAFRREVTDAEVALVFGKLTSLKDGGAYLPVAVPELALSEAERLSASFSTRLGTRSLDILHVSHALALGVKEFLTFDLRQATLAAAAGLKVPQL